MKFWKREIASILSDSNEIIIIVIIRNDKEKRRFFIIWKVDNLCSNIEDHSLSKDKQFRFETRFIRCNSLPIFWHNSPYNSCIFPPLLY